MTKIEMMFFILLAVCIFHYCRVIRRLSDILDTIRIIATVMLAKNDGKIHIDNLVKTIDNLNELNEEVVKYNDNDR